MKLLTYDYHITRTLQGIFLLLVPVMLSFALPYSRSVCWMNSRQTNQPTSLAEACASQHFKRLLENENVILFSCLK